MAVLPKPEPHDPALPAPPKPTEAERKSAAQALTAERRRNAWPVHRWPAERHPMGAKTRVHLPRTHMGAGGAGADVRQIYEGADLNLFVYRWYEEAADTRAEHGVNYVAEDRVSMRRHEYLGPDPRVAGYWYDERGEVHIYFLDGFLHDQWTDGEKWTTMEVVMDVRGEWVEKDY